MMKKSNEQLHVIASLDKMNWHENLYRDDLDG